jgi:hypothetical protein
VEKNHTAEPVPPMLEAVTHNDSKPEWARIPEVVQRFGIKRTRLFELIADGQIKSVSLRRPGCVRGVRIINCDSVRSLLEALANREVK